MKMQAMKNPENREKPAKMVTPPIPIPLGGERMPYGVLRGLAGGLKREFGG